MSQEKCDRLKEFQMVAEPGCCRLNGGRADGLFGAASTCDADRCARALNRIAEIIMKEV